MDLRPIDSDALTGVDYDGRRQVLTVRFESGGVYEYLEVEPELYAALIEAQPHPWSRLADEVKARPYRRIG